MFTIWSSFLLVSIASCITITISISLFLSYFFLSSSVQPIFSCFLYIAHSFLLSPDLSPCSFWYIPLSFQTCISVYLYLLPSFLPRLSLPHWIHRVHFHFPDAPLTLPITASLKSTKNLKPAHLYSITFERVQKEGMGKRLKRAVFLYDLYQHLPPLQPKKKKENKQVKKRNAIRLGW